VSVDQIAPPVVEGASHRHVDVGGVALHVAEAGSGPPVLLLHGWPQHWYVWRKIAPELAEGHRVICPDVARLPPDRRRCGPRPVERRGPGGVRRRAAGARAGACLGARDLAIDHRALGRWREHADAMRLELRDDSGHFIAEELPEVVVERARELFATADALS
jgi:hypothetical protein